MQFCGHLPLLSTLADTDPSCSASPINSGRSPRRGMGDTSCSQATWLPLLGMTRMFIALSRGVQTDWGLIGSGGESAVHSSGQARISANTGF